MESSQPIVSAPGLAKLLDTLAVRPVLLASLALALATLSVPYAHLTHDARIYSVQVLNHAEPGCFGQDLFFRFGSQDSYSVFSLIFAPDVAILGIPWTFFLGYLVTRILFVLAVLRLSFVLFGTSRAAVVCTLLLAGLPVGYGALGIFQVNEAFLTPRLPTFALVLLGVADLLAGHTIRASLLFGLGLVLHPLIALVGFPLLVGWFVCRRWPRWGMVLFTAVMLAGEALFLFLPDLGWMVFGQMDGEWLDHVAVFTRYNFPFQWEESDWLYVGFSSAVVILTALVVRQRSPELATLLGLTVVLGVGGLLATMLASVRGYELLFQGQPYRMIWLTHLLCIPCAILLVMRAWATSSELARGASVLLALLVVMHVRGPAVLIMTVAVCPVVLLLLHGRTSSWLSLGLGVSFAVAVCLADTVRYLAWGPHKVEYLLRGLPVGLWVPFVLGALLLVARRTLEVPGRVAAGALAVFLAFSSVLFVVRQLPILHGDQGPDAEFVASVIDTGRVEGVRPMVYWSVDTVEVVWLELRACSYFNRLQAVGSIFHRETALEAARRARMVGHFELVRLREKSYDGNGSTLSLFERLYGLQPAQACPTLEQVERLAEDGVDFVVSEQNLGGRYLGSNGRVFVYDCRQLRAQRLAEGVASR
jgi:hypothetical protein